MPDDDQTTPRPRDAGEHVQLDDPILASGFTVVPNILFRAPVFPAVSVGAKWLYLGLLRYGHDGSPCFPGQAHLSRELGLSEASITRHLAELQACGLVVVTRRGQTKTNLYRLPRLESVLAAGGGAAPSSAGPPTVPAPMSPPTSPPPSAPLPRRKRGRPPKAAVTPPPPPASPPAQKDAPEAARRQEATRIWTTVYSTCGADITLMTSAAKARAYRKACDLLEIARASDILDCAAYMVVTNKDWWDLHPMTLEAVEKQLRTWLPAGRPTGHAPHPGTGARVRRVPKKGDRDASEPAPESTYDRTSLDRDGAPPRPDRASARARPPTDDVPLF